MAIWLMVASGSVMESFAATVIGDRSVERPFGQSIATVTVTPGAVGAATATCPSGRGGSHATGGGYFDEAPDAAFPPWARGSAECVWP